VKSQYPHTHGSAVLNRFLQNGQSKPITGDQIAKPIKSKAAMANRTNMKGGKLAPYIKKKIIRTAAAPVTAIETFH
jgi:hypothetical protein